MQHAFNKLAQTFVVAPMRLNSSMMIRRTVICIQLSDATTIQHNPRCGTRIQGCVLEP
jgi:hypothetical protein